jgi:hypothetical protein
VIAAAEAKLLLPGKVDNLWAILPKTPKGEIERTACWDLLDKDDELAILVGKGDLGNGKK